MFSKSKNQTKITKKIIPLDISMCKKVFQKIPKLQGVVHIKTYLKQGNVNLNETEIHKKYFYNKITLRKHGIL